MGRERCGPVGLERLIRGPARKVPPVFCKGRYVGGDSGGAGHVCGYGVPYQDLEGGLKRALEEDPRPGHPTKLDGGGKRRLGVQRNDH